MSEPSLVTKTRMWIAATLITTALWVLPVNLRRRVAAALDINYEGLWR